MENKLDQFSLFLLGIFFFLLAIYSKQFAYLNIKLESIPVFISEATLTAILVLRVFHWKNVLRSSRWPIYFLGAFLAWGFVRLGISVASGQVKDFGLIESLKQTCIFYQGVWFLVPFLFSGRELKKLMVVSFSGIAVAEIFGWLGFLLMGTYGSTYSRLIGFPVGDEVLLPLYPLVYLLLAKPYPELISLTFGHLWLTQFVIYMKRTWVFSVLVFALPLLIWRAGKDWPSLLKRLTWPFLLGLALAGLTLFYVSAREEPIFYHRQQSESLKQRENMPKFGRAMLFLLDQVFPYTDPLETQVSIGKIIFKGDLAQNGSTSPTSLMAFRMHLWHQAWDGFLEHPWVGNGFGTRMMTTQLNGLPAVVDGRWISGPHNSFLAVMNRLGLIGFFLLSGLLGWVGWIFLRSPKSDFSWLVAASVVNLHFFALFNVCLENPQGGIWYWFFLGTALAVVYAEAEVQESAR